MSGRGVSSTLLTGMNAGAIQLFVAVKMLLTPGTFAYKTGAYDLTFDGVTFKADGTFRGLGAFEENRELSSSDLPIAISLTDSSLLAALTANTSVNDEVDVYVGLMSSPGVLLDYAKFGPYLFGKPMIAIDPNNPVATLTCQRYTNRLAQVNNLMFTDEDQQNRNSGDKFFSLINTLQYKQMTWGSKAVGQEAPSTAGGAHAGGGKSTFKPVGQRTVLQ